MLRLFRKFSFTYVVYLALVVAVIYPLYNHDRLEGPNPLDLSFPFYLTFGVFWLIAASVWLQEQIEDKSKGYEFLKLLPVKAVEIVGAKFASVLITIVLYVVFHCAAFWMISSSPDYMRPSRTMMINAGVICLLTAGIFYTCIFRFGFAIMRIVLFVVMFLFIAFPILLNVLLMPILGVDKYDLIEWVSGINGLWATLTGLALYFGMFLLSTRVMKAEKKTWRRN